MLGKAQIHEIANAMGRLTTTELRLLVRDNAAIQTRVREIHKREEDGYPRFLLRISEKSLIDGRLRELTGRLVRGTMTEPELREFVELQTIRSELLKPERLRRFHRHWKQAAAARKHH